VSQIRNWKRFQHFKNRRPPWIKLYRDLLDDLEWHNLPGESAKTLVSLWLIASEGDNGQLPDFKTLAFRLRTTEKTLKNTLSTLSHWLIRDDIELISERYQDDPSETETETETEREKEAPKNGVCVPVATLPQKPKQLTPLQRIVEGWKVTVGVARDDKAWDRAHYNANVQHAKKLLDLFTGDSDGALDCIEAVYHRLKSKGLDVSLAGIVRNSTEYRKDWLEKRSKVGV
jgi:hypothetical protein